MAASRKLPTPTNYPREFKALAARADAHLQAVRTIVAEAYALMAELVDDHDIDWWSDEFHHLERVYRFDVMDVAINAVGDD